MHSSTYYRSNTCGELRSSDIGKTVTLSGWVNIKRDLGEMVFIDLRDRHGLTQLVFMVKTDEALCDTARTLGREWVIQISGKVAERSNKNSKIPTGDIEIIVDALTILNASEVPPFTMDDDTDGGEELRMKYRYLDLRRPQMQKRLMLRASMLRCFELFANI